MGMARSGQRRFLPSVTNIRDIHHGWVGDGTSNLSGKPPYGIALSKSLGKSPGSLKATECGTVIAPNAWMR